MGTIEVTREDEAVRSKSSESSLSQPREGGGGKETSAVDVSDVTAVVQAEPHRTWRSYFWDTLDKSPEEKRFLFKLDAALLTIGGLSFFIKYLDQVNINNAFVSGMQDDLKLFGNELNYMQTCWTIGYVVGEIPSNLILTRIRPSYWLPICEILWSVCTLVTSRATTPTHLYVLRFLVGLFESTCYPGIQYVIGSWYRKDELAKRSCIFHASGFVGNMFSGYLMAAVYHLGGIGGFKGWQWLFLIDGVISLPIALAAVFLLPDLPDNTRAFYLTADDVRIARRRVQLEGRAERAPWTRAKVARILSSWHVWLLSLMYAVFNNATGGMAQPAFQLWLKSEGYSVSDYNVYPALANIVGLVSTLAYAWTSDTVCRGARWPPIVFSAVANIIGHASLSAWYVPAAWKWVCYMMMGFGGGVGGMAYAWAAEITSDDREERAIVSAALTDMAWVVQAWLPLLIWKVTEAPRYFKGFVTMTVLWALLIAIVFLVRHLQKRDLAQKAALLGRV